MWLFILLKLNYCYFSLKWTIRLINYFYVIIYIYMNIKYVVFNLMYFYLNVFINNLAWGVTMQRQFDTSNILIASLVLTFSSPCLKRAVPVIEPQTHEWNETRCARREDMNEQVWWMRNCHVLVLYYILYLKGRR